MYSVVTEGKRASKCCDCDSESIEDNGSAGSVLWRLLNLYSMHVIYSQPFLNGCNLHSVIIIIILLFKFSQTAFSISVTIHRHFPPLDKN